MIRRFPSLAVLLLAVSLMSARVVLAAAIPAEIRSNPDADTLKAQIKAAVEEEVAKLVATDPDARRLARDILITNVDPAGPNKTPPTTIYLDTYATVLRDALLPHVAAPDLNVRLNVAIVTARIAEKSDTYRLQPVVEKLLEDKTEGVVVWALRGAKFTLPPILRAGGPNAANNKVLPGIVAAASAHKSGLVMHEVYDALSLNLLNAAGGLNQAQWQPMLTITAPKVYELYRKRVDLFKDSAPSEPSADQTAIKFLSHRLVLSSVTPEQQVKIVQAMYEHAILLSEKFKAANGAERDALGNMTKQAAGGLWSWASFRGSDSLKASLLRVSSMPKSDYNTVIPTVPDVLKAIVAVEPGVKLMNLPTGPATQPTAKTAN